MHRFATLSLITACAVLSACSKPTTAPDPAYLEEIEQWRQNRIERLTAPDGWLTLVGLHWLEPGDNVIGSSPSANVQLADRDIPDEIGNLILEGRAVVFEPRPEHAILVNGVLADEPLHLRSDAAEGGPDMLTFGGLSLHIIARGERLGVRVKDPEASTRRSFPGIEHFPVDPTFRVTARLDAFDTPKWVAVSTAVGTEETLMCPGELHFSIHGRKLTLQPWIDEPGQTDLFIVFRDRTSGTTTYGAGRFLTAALEGDGTAVVDFNKAFSPPCAFTPFATCPLPPPENSLPIPITAGEKHQH